MKHLKFLFLPLVIVSLFSFVKADCLYDTGLDAIVCEPGDMCTSTNCYCNDTIPGVIGSGNTCGELCEYDLDLEAYDCIPTQYCPIGAGQCLCGGGPINEGNMCTPIIGSCTLDGKTLFNGQSWIFFQAPTVDYPGTCGVGVLRTCSVVAGIGTLSAASGYIYSGCIAGTPPPPPTGSCTTPRGTTIASGSSITGYPTSSVACGSSCSTTTTATCLNGNWSGNYNNARYSTCHVNNCGNGGGGGGGGSAICTTNYLVCSSGTRALAPGSYCYGELLGTSCSMTGNNIGTGNLPVGSIAGSPRSTEMNNAYLRAYAHGITTMNTIQKAKMGGVLYRAHMAKMISNFAISLGGLTPNTGKNCTFNDISNQSAELKFYIKLSCQLGLMGLNANGTPNHTFNPNAIVTRAQFGTILSRVIRGSQYNGGNPYYSPHLLALKNEDIMTKISNPTKVDEIRGYVMIMMKRAYEGDYLNN